MRLAAGHSEAAAGHLVAHYLDAAVVDAGLESTHDVVGKEALLDGFFGAAEQGGVGAENLGDSLGGVDAVFRGPDFFPPSLRR